MAAKPRKLNATKANSQAPPRSLSAQHNEVVHRAVDLAVLMVFFSGTYAVGRMTFASSVRSTAPHHFKLTAWSSLDQCWDMSTFCLIYTVPKCPM